MLQDSLHFPQVDPDLAREYAEATAGQLIEGMNFFDASSVLQLLVRFALNMLVVWVIVQFFYYKKSKRRDFYFTFILFSLSMFLLVYLLKNVRWELGMGLGLFAIFSILRYRTESVPIREMTYLFLIIALSVINGMAMAESIIELLLTNLLFIAGTFVMESSRFLEHTASKVILYDNIKLVTPEKYDELMADLKLKTGLPIERLEVGHIDYLRDAAYVKIFYKAPTFETGNAIEIGNVDAKFDMSGKSNRGMV
jgi:hypothetical protein